MNQKAQTAVISVDDIVASSVNDLIFLKTKNGKDLGSATVIVVDGGYAGLIRVKYGGMEETTRTGHGEDAARRLAYRYHSQTNHP